MAIIDVIKYDGSPDVFAWKHPENELGTWTQLIVNQSQQAILFKDGRALDMFGPGRHTLSTANIPILNRIVNLPFGGKSPFAAEVWYVNQVSALDVKWGTANPIQIQDPKYNIIVPVRAFGQMGIKIADSRKFLVKLVGTLPEFNQVNMVNYFRGLIIMNINSMLSSYLIHRKVSVLEINAYIAEISRHFADTIAPAFEEFGIELMNLYIHNVNLPEEDPSVIRLREALARKAEMDIIGYTYQQERSFDTLEGAAKNEGSMQSGLMGAGLGMGMGVGLGGTFGGEMSQMSRVMSTTETPGMRLCEHCHHPNQADASFCSKCGKTLGIETAVRDCNKCGHSMQKGTKFCPNCGDKYHACPSCGADNPENANECVQCHQPMPSPCPSCNHINLGNIKFCGNCGSSLVLKCSHCHHEVKPGQKFCLECGNKLQDGSDT
ncbi:SPFH domain-containing protein [Paenibacillus sp. NPDC056933]|uniref:SPFH domain-containing protein n=1 Tax=Paenibacillus sp. NPDC056933 TaxID=3345968 RepID=UPI00364585F3